MAVERESRDGDIVFECDNCGDTEETHMTVFTEAIKHVKNTEGWWIRNIDNEWVHFCSRDCFEVWKTTK